MRPSCSSLMGPAVLLLCAHAIEITGATGGVVSGVLPLRYEINDFVSHGAALDLYVLALKEMQAQPQSNPLSYFQIAGIHGFPAVPWDSAIGPGPNKLPGYCMHGSVLFPTWHRPYLALIEVVWSHAQVIAHDYPPEQRHIYTSAATTLRMPFWDWSTNPSLPYITTTEILIVNTPTGRQNVSNPFYEYIFHPGSEGNGIPVDGIGQLASTTRHYNFTSRQRNDSAASARMQDTAGSRASLVYQLLASENNYTRMATLTTDGGNSIEGIHNDIHNIIGGTGHMSYLAIAAFDPIFWLHHANIDRLFAIWQVLHPESYVMPSINPFGSYFEAAGTLDLGNTSLAPFRSTGSAAFHTSDGVRDIAIFRYTYPDLGDRNLSAAEQTTRMRSKINKIYAPSAAEVTGNIQKLREREFELASRGVTLGESQLLGVNNAERQWSLEVITEMDMKVQTPYSVEFFLVPYSSAALRRSEPTLIGSVTFLQVSNLMMEQLEQPAHMSLHGQVSLTHLLIKAVKCQQLQDISPRSVVPFLQRHLAWTVKEPYSGETMDNGELLSLRILVQSRTVQCRVSDDEFPVYGDYETHWEVTRCHDA